MNKRNPRKRYSPEFKTNAAQRAIQSGNVTHTAKELGINYQMLSLWVRQLSGSTSSKGSFVEQKAQTDEINRLKRQNAFLQEEVAILKKATAYFSRKELKSATPL